jgi:amino acid adenylation domain-containing protein
VEHIVSSPRKIPDSLPDSLFELVARHAENHPDYSAIGVGDDVLTYAELAARCRRFAGQIRDSGASGGVVCVCVPRGPDLIVSILAVLAAGAAYLPLDFGLPAARRRALASGVKAALIVTPSAQAASFEGFPVLPVEAASDAGPAAALPGETGPDDLAYVIYTSGSTGEPKPVGVTHRSVLRHADALRDDMELTPDDRVLQFASIGFDAAAEELYPTFLAGGRVVPLPTAAPTAAEIERLIEEAGVTVVNLPTSYWHQWTADLRQAGRGLPDSVRLVVIGGEAASSAVARHWLTHVRVPLLNTYGVTEATITSTVLPVGPHHLGQEAVPIGLPIRGTTAAVLDADRAPVPPGTAGELYIGGAGLARGYLHNPELTAERFVMIGTDRMLRTGDLVRQDPDGLLHHLGRIDQQVKVRGHRIEPAEVSAALMNHPDLAEAHVNAVRDERSGDNELVAYVVPVDWHRVPSVRELRTYLGERLPDALVPASYLVLSALPLGPNGKIDRSALPTISLRRRDCGDYHAPRTDVERGLAQIWEQVLHVDRVGVDDDVFELGAHSLTAIRVAGEIRQRFGVDLDVRTLFTASTIGQLAVAVVAAGRDGGSLARPAITSRPADGPVPLSSQQEQIWFIGQAAPDSVAYQTQTTFRIVGDLDLDALDRAVTEISRRHEILRTTFPAAGGLPTQVVHRPRPVKVARYDVRAANQGASGDAEEIVRREVTGGFDVTRLPLIRWTVIRLADSEYELILIEQHLVHDGWSFAQLIHELRAIYTAYSLGLHSPLPEPAIQYRDYARWQRDSLGTPVMRAQAEFWRRRFGEPPPELVLPTDFPRPRTLSFRGRTMRLELPSRLPDALRAFCREHRVTLFAAMYAGFAALLSHYARETDICVGSAFANRRQPETAHLIGMLVNTVLLRIDLAGDPTFATLAGMAHDVVLDASANQEFPFLELVRELNPKREVGRNPITQILFSANDSPLTEFDLGAASGTIFEPGNGSAKMDLDVVVIPRAESQRGDATHADDRITLLWEYSTELFDEATMRRMAAAYIRLLTAGTADPGLRVSELPLLDERERYQVLPDWQRGHRPAAGLVPVHQAVAGHAQSAPHAPAIRDGAGEISYAELAGRAQRLAAALIGQGAGPETVVGLCLPRGADLVIAQLAVLFAGAAYLPMDPADPANRRETLLSTAGALFTITPESLAGWADIPAGQNARPDLSGPGNLAYVIGTSGSTGAPKCVLVEHRSLANFCAYRRRVLNLRPGDRMTGVHSPAFDASTGEIWSTLAAGACLCFPDDETRLTPRLLRDWLIAERIDIVNLPTPLGEQLLELDWPDTGGPRTMIVGGDRLYRRPRADIPFRVLNEYGPTETTDTAVSGFVEPGPDDQAPGIGRPIDGVSAYVLDPMLRPLPIGVVGELCIGGAGVARGYAGRDDLTAERFRPDPFAAAPDARMYRTGDLARYRPDGELECLGRVDAQVKVRGYRIEPGEVAAVLRSHPDVAEAHVVLDQRNRSHLVAYLVAGDPGRPPAPGQLKQYLSELLPAYMIPNGYLTLPRLRRLPSGKVNPAELPDPALSQPADLTRRAPASELERGIAKAWAAVLGLDEVGADENFFDLGGHSLLLSPLAERLSGELGLRVGVLSFFEYPTVTALATALASDAGRDGELERSAARADQRRQGRNRLAARRAGAEVDSV